MKFCRWLTHQLSYTKIVYRIFGFIGYFCEAWLRLWTPKYVLLVLNYVINCFKVKYLPAALRIYFSWRRANIAPESYFSLCVFILTTLKGMEVDRLHTCLINVWLLCSSFYHSSRKVRNDCKQRGCESFVIF